MYLLHVCGGRIDVLPQPYAVGHEVLLITRDRWNPERGGLVDLRPFEVQRLLHPAERIALGRGQADVIGLSLPLVYLAPEEAAFDAGRVGLVGLRHDVDA